MDEKTKTKVADQPPAHIIEAVDVVRRFLRRLRSERRQTVANEGIEWIR